MNLKSRNIRLKKILVRDNPVLALDTGFEADSLEGLRLVKASRGDGWVWHEGNLVPWVTKGVLQEDRRLIVWGEVDPVPEGEIPEQWPLEGPEGKAFLAAFVQAWTSLAQVPARMGTFGSAGVIPLKTAQGWSFVFPPLDLRGVLDSLLPLSDRLAWDHIRHPDLVGIPSWAFTSAALAVQIASGGLFWAQPDEEHLRQEIRDLKRTLKDEELPLGPDENALKLWAESLTGRGSNEVAGRWRTWAQGNPIWEGEPADAVRTAKHDAARLKRERRRGGAAFWRRKGTLVTAGAIAAGVLLLIVGSVVWGIIKPDPTDTWTPDQVVKGYYAAVNDMDSDLLRKITSFTKDKEPELNRDQEEATNLYVIRQVRTAYEHQSPVLDPGAWEGAGKPALVPGQMLYGVTGLEFTQSGDTWTVKYRKWVNEGGEENVPVHAVGAEVSDRLVLVKTDRGWKVSSLQRTRQPLP